MGVSDMDKPCKYCDKSTHKNVGCFEQECNGTCEKFDVYAERVSIGLDEILSRGKAILAKYDIEF